MTAASSGNTSETKPQPHKRTHLPLSGGEEALRRAGFGLGDAARYLDSVMARTVTRGPGAFMASVGAGSLDVESAVHATAVSCVGDARLTRASFASERVGC